MMRRLEASHDNVIGYSLAGDVSDDEYRRAASQLRDDIERVAIVSDDRTTEWLSKLSDVTGAVDTEHFSMDEEDKAWAWLE